MTKRLPACAIALSLVGFALSACVSYIPEDATQPFRVGWANGCDTGYETGGREQYTHQSAKNEKRYEEDADYRQGWDKGFALCYEEASRYLELMHGNGGNVN